MPTFPSGVSIRSLTTWCNLSSFTKDTRDLDLILDMMGRIAGKSMGQLIGEIHHPEIELYQATEYRDKPVDESMELIRPDVAANSGTILV